MATATFSTASRCSWGRAKSSACSVVTARARRRRSSRSWATCGHSLAEILYSDRDIGGLPPYAVARLGFGFVPQERGIFPSLTVRENLTVFARSRGKGYWTLRRIFELFPVLQARESNLGFQLSGGEQQMLSIARALMLNPALLLLDEPSEGLAPMIVQQIIEVLARLKREGLAILLVEQNLAAAFAVGDRHHVMNKGEIRFSGSSEELKGNDFCVAQLPERVRGQRGPAIPATAFLSHGRCAKFRHKAKLIRLSERIIAREDLRAIDENKGRRCRA